jgi:hypothetical protein
VRAATAQVARAAAATYDRELARPPRVLGGLDEPLSPRHNRSSPSYKLSEIEMFQGAPRRLVLTAVLFVFGFGVALAQAEKVYVTHGGEISQRLVHLLAEQQDRDAACGGGGALWGVQNLSSACPRDAIPACSG